MASSDAELTLPDGFPLAPKGCEKPSQKFFDCFTAAGMQKDVAVRSQRPKNKAWNGHAFRAAGRGRRRARPRGVRGAARRVPQVPGVARTKTAAAGRVPRARGVPARRRRARRARVTTTTTTGGGQYNVVVCECSVQWCDPASAFSPVVRLACEDTLEHASSCSASTLCLLIRRPATLRKVTIDTRGCGG